MSSTQFAASVWWHFWSRVDAGPLEMCWEWTGPVSHKGGYAQLRIDKKSYTAHRLSCTFARGAIPEGMVVRHACDNPKCCNPMHLEIGTHLDNHKDMVVRGRKVRSGAKGIRNCKSKLNDKLVREIRVEYALGTTSTIKLARKHGVSQSLISHITNNRIWKHVQ